MGLKQFFIFLLLSFTNTVAHANCFPQDLSAELGPVRSQGNIGWCYANTAADLISFKYKKKWRGTQASAIFIALGYNLKQNNLASGSYIFADGGDIRAAISYAHEVGYSCPRPLDNIFILGGLNLPVKQKLLAAEKLKSLYDNRLKSSQAWNEWRNFLYYLQNKKSIISLISEEALEKALAMELNLAVIQIAKEICHPYKDLMTISIPRSDIGRYFIEDKEYYDDILKLRVMKKPNLMELIDRQITAGNVVGVDYEIKLIGKNPKDTDSHASVIVGREMKSGQCYYKIRNSWGPECVIKGENGKDIPRYNSNVECTEGHVWVKATDLKANLTSIAYIRP